MGVVMRVVTGIGVGRYKTCIILLLFLGQFSGAFFWLRRYLEIITTLMSYDK
jgi:hypothetical protein